jgi:transposase-like protein
MAVAGEYGQSELTVRLALMQDDLHHVKFVLSEEACLEHLLMLRFGSSEFKCPACSCVSHFLPAVKRRACLCDQCGYAVYPAHGTPLEKLRIALKDWYAAIYFLTSNQMSAQDLVRRLGISEAALEQLKREMRPAASPVTPAISIGRWQAEIYRFVAMLVGVGSGADLQPAASRTPKNGPHAHAEPSPRSRNRDPLAEGQRSTPLTSWRFAASGLLAGVMIASAVAIGLQQLNRPSVTEDAELPTLSPMPPRPSIMIAAVEEDIAGAKAAVEEITKTRASVTAPALVEMPAPRPNDTTIASTGKPNDVLRFGPIQVRRHVAETVVRASRIVGADPTLLMAVADKESSFATEVKAKTSSAEGLYQFIEQTWLGTLDEFGEKHGYKREADLIVRLNNYWTVSDPRERSRILDMRRDPYLSALLAGEMLRRDTLQLERKLGRHLTGGEIYLLHFLGPRDAQSFITQVAGGSNLIAADILRKPAEANRSIFYDREGGKTVSEVHQSFEKMIGTRIERYRAVREFEPGPPITEAQQ